MEWNNSTTVKVAAFEATFDKQVIVLQARNSNRNNKKLKSIDS